MQKQYQHPKRPKYLQNEIHPQKQNFLLFSKLRYVASLQGNMLSKLTLLLQGQVMVIILNSAVLLPFPDLCLFPAWCGTVLTFTSLMQHEGVHWMVAFTLPADFLCLFSIKDRKSV